MGWTMPLSVIYLVLPSTYIIKDAVLETLDVENVDLPVSWVEALELMT